MVDRIGPREAKRRMDRDGWVFVDVRSVPEFEQGHPNGAYNVPLLHLGRGGMEPNPRFIDAMKKAFAPDAKIIVGCKSGGRSLRAAEVLEAEGFTSVVDQRAGYGGARDPFGGVTEEGWVAEGLPTSTEASPGRAWVDLDG